MVSYNSISLGDTHRTDDAKFVLEVTSSPNDLAIDMPYVTCRSKKTDSQAAMDVFCDDNIFAVEPGIPGVHPGGEREYMKSITTSDQQAVHKPGCKAMYHWGIRYPEFWGPTSNSCCQLSGALSGLSPIHDHQPCGVPPLYTTAIGGNIVYFWDDCDQDIIEGGNQVTLYTHLRSFGAGIHHDNAFKNRIYGYRRGGYFFVSYGGKVLDTYILGSGEYAMDLSNISSNGDYELFSDGHYRFTNVVDNSGGLGIGGIAAGAFAVACAITAPISAPWAVAFGVVSGVAGIVEAVDTETGTDGQAHGATCIIVSKSAPWTSTTWESFVEDEDYSGTGDDGGWHPINPGLSFNAQAGNQFTIYLEVESVCSQTMYTISNTEASSKVEVKTDTVEDWGTLSLSISE